MSNVTSLPNTGFIRLSNILAPRGPIPIGKSTWWEGASPVASLIRNSGSKNVLTAAIA